MEERQQAFAALMRRVNEGSQDAARELYDLYGSHILRVVRRRLSKELRSKFDSIDFVQDVWMSFFASPHGEGKFDRPEALIAYLVKIAHNKVVDTFRQRMQTRKYNVQREHSLESA